MIVTHSVVEGLKVILGNAQCHASMFLLLVLLLVYVCSSNSVELTKVGVMLHIYCEKERGEDNVK